MTLRQEKLNVLFKKLIARFLHDEVGIGLITITNCIVSRDIEHAAVSVSIYPENREKEIFPIINQKQKELREFLKKNTRIKILPRVIFTIDTGEQHRQKINKLLDAR